MTIERIEPMTRAAFEEYLRRPENRERRLELINGEVVEKMSPTQQHGAVDATIAMILGQFVRAHGLGRVYGDVNYYAPDDDNNERIPDLSFVAGEKPIVKQGAAPYMPDLAIEIRSPNETYDSMRGKAIFYLENGSRLVWLVYPAREEVEVVTRTAEGDYRFQIVKANEQLTGGDVLPGFSVIVGELFT